MKFISTRGETGVNPSEAILNGIAKDGGLYVPESFPTLSLDDLTEMTELDYADRAAFILSKYLTDYTEEELLEYAHKAYSRFDGEPAPLVKIDDGTYIMELWHGPTLAFKDIALTILPYLLTGARKKTGEDRKTLILVATSGDTGKAALEGFSDVEGTEIVVFYPSEGVSEMQKLQMQTTVGENVHVIGIEGNFDDAQSAVKAIFKSPQANEKLRTLGYDLSSANSINFGRLAPQIVYYVSAYVDLLASEEIAEGEEVNFVVPSGNFGNILAGYYAKRMGVPINKLIVASNKNNILTDFFNTGEYDVNRKFYRTMSPSMDILISSNLERLLFELGGRDTEFVKSLMSDLAESGRYEVDEEAVCEKLGDFLAYCSSEEETKQVMDNYFDVYGYLLDPHTAVGASVFNKYIVEYLDEETPAVLVSTASPFKFPSDVYSAISHSEEDDPFKAAKKLAAYTAEEIPEQIDELRTKEILHGDVIPKEAIMDTLISIFDKQE